VAAAIVPLLAPIQAALPFGYAIETAGVGPGIGQRGDAPDVLVMLSLLMQSFAGWQ
jgi:hypothetical protein